LSSAFTQPHEEKGATFNISISSGMGIRCRSRKNKGQAVHSRIMRDFPGFWIVFKNGVIWLEFLKYSKSDSQF
jgi:hypothetical protein